jgi:hypothetical protein
MELLAAQMETSPVTLAPSHNFLKSYRILITTSLWMSLRAVTASIPSTGLVERSMASEDVVGSGASGENENGDVNGTTRRGLQTSSGTVSSSPCRGPGSGRKRTSGSKTSASTENIIHMLSEGARSIEEMVGRGKKESETSRSRT